MSSKVQRGGGRRYLAQTLLLALAYALAGKLSLLLAIPPGYATAIWPPSGIALAAVLLGGRRHWLGVALGSLLVNLGTASGDGSLAAVALSCTVALTIAAGAALQALAGGEMIQRWVGYRNIFTQEVDVVRILLLGGPASCLINSLIGTTTLWLARLIPRSNYFFNWWTWWVGDAIGVLIFTPLVCAWALRPIQPWLRKQVALTIPLAIMLALIVSLFVFVSTRETARLHAEFEHSTEQAAGRLRAVLGNDLIILQGLKSLMTALPDASPEQFHLFAGQALASNPDLKALEWLPRVPLAQRTAFEATMRQAGASASRIWEEGARGEGTAAGARADYFPIAYVEPLAENRKILGYDVAAESVRRVALLQARDSGKPTATARIRLIQDRGGQWGALIFAPVYRGALDYPTAQQRSEHLLGFSLAVFRIGDLTRSSMQDLADNGWSLQLSDDTEPGNSALLYQAGGLGQPATAQIAMSRQLPLSMAGRRWTLTFLLPADYLVAHRSWQAWSLLAVGLLITGLLGLLILMLIGRQAKVEELVHSQTVELIDAERRFRRLLENTPDAMVITDQAGRIQLVNRQIERLFGYARGEMIGQAIELLIPDHLRQRHQAHRIGYFGHPQVRPMGAGLELRARHKDGSEIPVEISLSPLETEDGIWATAAIRDISEHKAAELKLANYAKELERSNEELEQFAYVASHDLQAPLRSIIGFGQILQKEYLGKLSQDADTYIEYMVKSAAHMQALIRGLLTLSRIGKDGSASDQADGAVVLDEVLRQLQPSIAERGARITYDALPQLRCAPLELHQVLQNLIGNALKFGRPEQPLQIHIGAEDGHDQWTLSVRDNGIGIEAKYRERVFQVFQRLHGSDKYDGTGIGLAICRKIVQRHGGKIWIESATAQGTVFFFTLHKPAARSAADGSQR